MIHSSTLYSALADYYDTVVLAWSGAARAASWYVSQLPYERDAHITVLDIGCGTGLYTMAILRRYPNATVWAFDSNTAMVETLEVKLRDQALTHRVHVFVSSMEEKLPIPPDVQFDCMVASGVLEYGNISRILSVLTPRLKRGGYFFDAAIKDTIWGRMLAAFWGCRVFSSKEILDAFHTQGFASFLFPQLPSPYVFLNRVKQAYLFQNIQ